MPKATAVFDADDSRLSGAHARINGRMLALQSRIAKFAAAFIALRVQPADEVFGADGSAALLGMKPTTLASRIKALGISR